MGVQTIYRGHTSWIRAVAWAPDGRYIASTGKDQTVQVWEALTGKPVITYHGHTADVYAVAWSPDGRYVMSGGMDETVQLWDALTATCIWRYDTDAWVEDVAFSPTGQLVAVACLAGIHFGTYVWRVPEMALLATLRGSGEHMESLAWAPDGKHIACGDDEGVTIWDTESYQQRMFAHDLEEAVFALSWSPDQRWLAFGGTSGTIHICNSETGHIEQLYRGQRAIVHDIAWAPDSRSIASAGGSISVPSTPSHLNEDSVHIWAPQTGQTRYVFSGHSSTVQGVSWSPNGQYIVSGSWDCTAQVWTAQ